MGNKNSYLYGILIGVIVPVVIFGLLYGLNALTGIFSHAVILTLHKMMFVSVALNILPMRYYLVNKGVEKTGKGILIITIILIIIVTVVL